MIQSFGTGRIGVLFAPIVLIYFLCNLIIAITNITRYNPRIFKVRNVSSSVTESVLTVTSCETVRSLVCQDLCCLVNQLGKKCI